MGLSLRHWEIRDLGSLEWSVVDIGKVDKEGAMVGRVKAKFWHLISDLFVLLCRIGAYFGDGSGSRICWFS